MINAIVLKIVDIGLKMSALFLKIYTIPPRTFCRRSFWLSLTSQKFLPYVAHIIARLKENHVYKRAPHFLLKVFSRNITLLVHRSILRRQATRCTFSREKLLDIYEAFNADADMSPSGVESQCDDSHGNFTSW